MKLPHQLNHIVLETYFKDPLEFEARYVYGLSKKEPYKRFVKEIHKMGDAYDDASYDAYDDAIFWHYQKQRIQEALKMPIMKKQITISLISDLRSDLRSEQRSHELTQIIDHHYDNVVVCMGAYEAPSQKSLRNFQSLQLILCGYCFEKKESVVLDHLEYWHLKGYKDIIEKVVYPRTLIDEVMGQLKNILNLKDDVILQQNAL